MITSVQGVLEARGSDWVQVAIGGIGLQLFATSATIATLGPVGATVRLHTQLQVRDDSLTLYGFATLEERIAFLALQTVSGVGPRLALLILSAMPPGRLAEAVEAEDADALVQTPGVGKRTAARLIVELKGKLEEIAIGEGVVPVAAPAADPDLTAALQALGYTPMEVRRALAGLPDADREVPLEDRLRRALQTIAPG